MNKKLKGMRGILTILATYAVMYLGMLMDSITGITPDMLKGAAMLAIPPTIKLIKTDLIPRLQELLNPKENKDA